MFVLINTQLLYKQLQKLSKIITKPYYVGLVADQNTLRVSSFNGKSYACFSIEADVIESGKIKTQFLPITKALKNVKDQNLIIQKINPIKAEIITDSNLKEDLPLLASDYRNPPKFEFSEHCFINFRDLLPFGDFSKNVAVKNKTAYFIDEVSILLCNTSAYCLEGQFANKTIKSIATIFGASDCKVYASVDNWVCFANDTVMICLHQSPFSFSAYQDSSKILFKDENYQGKLTTSKSIVRGFIAALEGIGATDYLLGIVDKGCISFKSFRSESKIVSLHGFTSTNGLSFIVQKDLLVRFLRLYLEVSGGDLKIYYAKNKSLFFQCEKFKAVIQSSHPDYFRS